jgi:hypothetical protein
MQLIVQLRQILFLPADDFGAEALRMARDAFLDDLVQSDERAAADKE